MIKQHFLYICLAQYISTLYYVQIEVIMYLLDLGLSLTDQSKTELGPHSPIQVSKKGLGIGTMVRTAASVASTAAKHAYAAASSARPSEEEMLPLKCCLMSISLPWENIAHDLLFKVTAFACQFYFRSVFHATPDRCQSTYGLFNIHHPHVTVWKSMVKCY